MFHSRAWAVLLGSLCCLMTIASAAEDRGLAARAEAKKSGKFLLAFFSDQQTDAAKNDALRSSVQESAMALPEKTSAVYIDIDDAAQQGLVKEFNLRYAPRPIVLVLSSNGTVSGSFQKPFTVKELGESLPGPGMQTAIKALQERKLVLLRIENKNMAGAADVARAAKGFLEDSRFKDNAIQVVIDPDDPEEQNSLRLMQIEVPKKRTAKPGTEQTTTSATQADTKEENASSQNAKGGARPVICILLAPPGIMVGKWEGAVTKEAIVQALMQAVARSSSCGSTSCVDPTCPPSAKEGQK